MRFMYNIKEEVTAFMKNMGKYIREAREKAGLTIEELAQKADVSPNYISIIELAKKVPRIDVVVKILNALEISANDVLLDDLVCVKQKMVDEFPEKYYELSIDNRKIIKAMVEAGIDKALELQKNNEEE